MIPYNSGAIVEMNRRRVHLEAKTKEIYECSERAKSLGFKWMKQTSAKVVPKTKSKALFLVK